MTFAVLDVVKTRDRHAGARLDGGDLPGGAEGTIVMVFDKPRRAYEVEFCDDEGQTIAQLALTPDQVAAV